MVKTIMKYLQVDVIDKGLVQNHGTPLKKPKKKCTFAPSSKTIKILEPMIEETFYTMSYNNITPPNLLPVVKTVSVSPSFDLLHDKPYESIPSNETDQLVKIHTDFIRHREFEKNGQIFGDTYKDNDLIQPPPGYKIVALPCTVYGYDVLPKDIEYIYLPKGYAFQWDDKRFIAGDPIGIAYNRNNEALTVCGVTRLFKIPAFCEKNENPITELGQGMWSLCGACETSVPRYQYQCHNCKDFMITRANSLFKYVLFPEYSSPGHLIGLLHGKTFEYKGSVYTTGNVTVRNFMGFQVFNAVKI